jgi:hypothetical protein
MQLIDETAFIFRVRLEPGLGREARHAVRRQIRQQLGSMLAAKRMENVAFEIEEVDRLKPDPVSGKTRLILKPEPARTSIGPREPTEATGRERVSPWPRRDRRPRSREDVRETRSTPSR